MRPISRAARRVALTAYRHWPLSFFGSLNLAFAFFVWTLSASGSNRAGIMLSLFIFLMLAFAIVSTHLANGTRRSVECSWSKNATLHEGENPLAFRIGSTSRADVFPLVRVHLRLAGFISSSGHNLYRVSFECRVAPGEDFDAGLFLPTSGELRLAGGYILRDALGLSRKPVGPVLHFEAAVHPRCAHALDVRVSETTSSASRNSLQRKNDGEKLFIREYVAGDLARDINWKALARTGMLLTRIPPESPREDRFVRLVIHVPRPSRPSGARRTDRAAVARSLVELCHVRALSCAFLESVRASAGDYGFAIRIDEREYRVAPGESLDEIKDIISAVGFRNESGASTEKLPAAGGFPAPDFPDHAWIIGASFDPVLRAFLPGYLESGCDVILSRGFAGDNARRGEGPRPYALPLISAGPGALSLPILFFSLLPNNRNRIGDIPASPRVAEFRCGVRP